MRFEKPYLSIPYFETKPENANGMVWGGRLMITDPYCWERAVLLVEAYAKYYNHNIGLQMFEDAHWYDRREHSLENYHIMLDIALKFKEVQDTKLVERFSKNHTKEIVLNNMRFKKRVGLKENSDPILYIKIIWQIFRKIAFIIYKIKFQNRHLFYLLEIKKEEN